MIRIFVGYDPREAVAYSVFCHSVLRRASRPVMFVPVRGDRRDASNDFVYSRFLVPWMSSWDGWAIWADGDMLCRADVAELWETRDGFCDVMVAKHDYRTRHPVKYLGQRNEDYPRKNWSSLMLINCSAYPWRRVTPDYVRGASGADLHRFAFLDDRRIGGLPLEWNWLVGEYAYNAGAKLAHFTVGAPCFEPYGGWDYADEWRAEMDSMLAYQGRDA